MDAEYYRNQEGNQGGVLSDASLAIAAAGELTSPLVLLRQLSLAIASGDISDAERKRLGDQLTLTTERALRLTGNLSLSSALQTELPLEPVNPVSVCHDVIHELTPLFAAHGKAISLQQRTRVPLLVANRQLLERILLSFGDNALPYGSKDHPVTMKISAHGDTVRIGVRDYGPAVPIDVWQRLDGRVARRAQAPLATRPQTSGVGLVTARRLAEIMKSKVGTIRHRDGATFYVDLHVSAQLNLL